MLSKNKRLNLRKNYRWVYGGYKLETDSLRLMFRLGENINPKVGVAVSTKLFHSSTQRNSVKRLVYFAIDQVYDKLKKNINLIVTPKIVDLDKDKLLDELNKTKEIYE